MGDRGHRRRKKKKRCIYVWPRLPFTDYRNKAQKEATRWLTKYRVNKHHKPMERIQTEKMTKSVLLAARQPFHCTIKARKIDYHTRVLRIADGANIKIFSTTRADL